MDILFLEWICECVEVTKQICERWSNSYPGLVHEDMHYPGFAHEDMRYPGFVYEDMRYSGLMH